MAGKRGAQTAIYATLDCGHRLRFRSAAPQARERLWCLRCTAYRVVSATGAGSVSA